MWKDSTGIVPLKDNGRLFNASNDKVDILTRKYQSVVMHKDPALFPAMKDITVKVEAVKKTPPENQPT